MNALPETPCIWQSEILSHTYHTTAVPTQLKSVASIHATLHHKPDQDFRYGVCMNAFTLWFYLHYRNEYY